MERTFFGNIVTSSSEDSAVLPGKIKVSDMGSFYFDGKYVLIEGPKWVAASSDYDFESLSLKRLRQVRAYRASWEIRLAFLSRKSMKELMDLESIMENSGHSFDSVRGAIAKRRFYLTPPGDATRPTIEVVKVSDPKVDTEHFGGKYIGYKGLSLTVESVTLFETKRLPKVEPIPAVLPLDGLLSWSWASPDLEVFA